MNTYWYCIQSNFMQSSRTVFTYEHRIYCIHMNTVPRGPSLPKYVYEICKSIGFVDLDVGFVDLDVGFVDLIVGFVGVTVGFLVDLDLSVGFGGFSIGFGFVKRCTRFGGVSDPSYCPPRWDSGGRSPEAYVVVACVCVCVCVCVYVFCAHFSATAKN